MRVWTLRVDTTVSVHPNYLTALEELRVNYASGEDVADADLLAHVQSQGLDVEIDEHGL